MSAVRAALAEMVKMMADGDEPGEGSPWYLGAVVALAAEETVAEYNRLRGQNIAPGDGFYLGGDGEYYNDDGTPLDHPFTAQGRAAMRTGPGLAEQENG